MTELESAEHTGLLSDGRELSLNTGNFPRADTGESTDDNGELREKSEKQIEYVKEQEGQLAERLKSVQELVRRTQADLKEVQKQRVKLEAKVRADHNKHHLMVHRPGPLEWVDSTWFNILSSTIVGLNFAAMVMNSSFPPGMEGALNNIFLLWYTVELSAKFAHHGMELFFGPIMAAWWNWLDLGIVVSGVADQWIMPILFGGGGGTLSLMRWLRLFRFLRILKVVKTFLVTDLDWLQSSDRFDLFIACVIMSNGIVISWELDYEWAGWVAVDNCFLVIYLFELLLRIKRWGRHFFNHPNDWAWNWLDFMIVGTGVLDLWLLPGITLVRREIFGISTDAHLEQMLPHSIVSLVKLMRLMRVLRLVRVLRSVPPLYTLLVGVYGAFQAMKWVIVLTLLTLYGGAIIFTNLVGKGMIYENQEAPPDAKEVFGTMGASLFSLFELMNGATEVIEPIKNVIVGKFLFAGFMVIANWAVLAILTAVVSENMISTSTKFAEAEKEVKAEENLKKSEQRLLEIFQKDDPTKSGQISKVKWNDMLNDGATRLELAEGTHLTNEDMVDLFECLAIDDTDDDDFYVDYRDLVHSLKANSTVADKRSVLHVMIRLRAMQDQMTKEGVAQTQQMNERFDEITKLMTMQRAA